MSTRVQSRYRRGLADRPVSGQPVTVRLTVRRFFCDHPDCSTRTFVEQLPGLTERYTRRTTDLRKRWRRSRWRWLAGPEHASPQHWVWR